VIVFNKLVWMRQRLLDLATPNLEWWAYLRKHHIDLKAVLPDCGILAVAVCRAVETADGQYIIDFDPDGVPCVVIEGQLIGNVEGVRDYVTGDLVAWPIGAPDHFATAMGPGAGVALLGPVAAFRLPSDKTPLKLFHNPESWLVNGCQGSVVIKPEAAQWLNALNVPLVCEDRNHASEISHLLGSAAKKRDIFIPDTRRAA
jgi:hypothetical protein